MCPFPLRGKSHGCVWIAGNKASLIAGIPTFPAGNALASSGWERARGAISQKTESKSWRHGFVELRCSFCSFLLGAGAGFSFSGWLPFCFLLGVASFLGAWLLLFRCLFFLAGIVVVCFFLVRRFLFKFNEPQNSPAQPNPENHHTQHEQNNRRW